MQPSRGRIHASVGHLKLLVIYGQSNEVTSLEVLGLALLQIQQSTSPSRAAGRVRSDGDRGWRKHAEWWRYAWLTNAKGLDEEREVVLVGTMLVSPILLPGGM